MTSSKFWILGALAGAIAAIAVPASTGAAPVKAVSKPSGRPAMVPITKGTAPSKLHDAPKPAECKPGYTLCDFIHPKITMAAQYSLAHLYSQGGEDCALALNILGAAEEGGIVGVHKVDEGKPALMARRKGTWWWKLIPDGEGAIVSELEKPPMVIFEKRMQDKPIALAYEIKEAWARSSLAGRTFTPPAAKNYGCQLPQGHVDDEPPEIIVPEECQCWPEFPPEMNVCGQTSWGTDLRCLPVPGKVCGVCEGASAKEKACLDANDKKHKVERQKCKSDYSPEKVGKYAAECVPKILECHAGKWKSCIDATKCMVDPEPLKEFKQCLDRESARYDKEAKRCRTL